MAFKYHGSILPNVANVGDTLTVDVDTMPATDKSVTIRVFEVQGVGDPAQTDALVLEVTGSVAGSALTLSGTPKIPTNPSGTPAPPQVTLTIAGQSFVVGLPRADQENGLFELVAEFTSGSTKDFRTTTSVVRFFRFLGGKRPVVTFLAEDPVSGPFFQHAQTFWKAHADAVVFKPSLEEMVKWLNDNQPGFGMYGEVNIVTHGNHFTTKTNILKGDTNRMLSHEKLDDIFGSSPKDPTAAARITVSGGLDADSRVVFRACSVGTNATFLKAVRDNVFGGKPTVLAPLFIQGYGVKSPGGGETEFFMEQLEFLLPTGPAPALTDPTFAAKFAANNHPTLKWADEQTAGWNTQDKTETRFKPPGDSPLTNDMGERSMFVNDAIPNPVRKTDDQLTEQCWADNNTPTNDEVFVADTTDGARSAWTTAMTTSALPADTNEIVAIHTSDTGVVDINELQASSNSTLDVGGKGTWAITDAGVGDKDLTLAFGPPATCTANVTGVKINGAAAPVGTATNLNLASGAATITFGTKSKIDCHFSKQTRVSVNATGFRVDRRRDLKDDTSNADFGQRTLVIPDITNAAHYGKVP